MRSLLIFFALAFVGMVFIPLMLLFLTSLFVLRIDEDVPEEDWDKVLAEGE